ncbi:MAG TPA: hypothetical protein VMT49_06255 [Steroidobacteraceae bacterium]|nr:hypothetical protein [Steroidobacteraceae bacterium]
MKFDWRTLGLLCGSALATAPLHAADAAADADFLEYLGSVDSNEAGWHDYLANTDVGKVAKPAAAPPAATPPAQPAAPASTPPALNAPRKVKQS